MSPASRLRHSSFMDSIVVISSFDDDYDERPSFGTGFIIDHDDQFTYVLTCAHVVADTATDGQVKINGCQGVVVASGQDQKIDLAVLKVAAFHDMPSISLENSGAQGKEVQISGYYDFDNKGELARRSLNGKLDKAFEVVTNQDQRSAKAWDLLIEDKDPLRAGYSGAPLIDLTTGRAVGVVTHRLKQGEEGHALDIDGLPRIWPRGHELVATPDHISPSPQWSGAHQRLPALLSAFPRVAISSSAVATLITVILRFFGAFEFLELQFYDHALTTRPPEPISDRIVIVETTTEDYDAQFENNEERTLTENISNSALLEAIYLLQEYEARVIVVDMYLPPNKQPWLDIILTPADSLVDIETSTTALELVQSFPDIYGVCGQPAEGYQDIPPPFQEAIPPSKVGFSNFSHDAGGLIRRHVIKEALLPQAAATWSCRSDLSLSILVALKYLEIENQSATPLSYEEVLSLDNYALIIGDRAIKGIDSFNYGGYYEINVNGFQVLLNYRNPESGDLRDAFPHYSIQKLRQGDFSAEDFKDKVVLIGFTDNSRANDNFWTPYGEVFGVTLHAHMIDQVISAVLDDRPLIWAWSDWVENLWIGTWALAGGLGGWYLKRPNLGGVFLLVGSAGIYLSALITMWIFSGWLPMAPALIAFVGANIWGAYRQQRTLLPDPRSI